MNAKNIGAKGANAWRQSGADSKDCKSDRKLWIRFALIIKTNGGNGRSLRC